MTDPGEAHRLAEEQLRKREQGALLQHPVEHPTEAAGQSSRMVALLEQIAADQARQTALLEQILACIRDQPA